MGTKIFIDRREPFELYAKIFTENGFDYKVVELEVGDFIYGDIVVERKTTDDLLSSLKDGRWHRQIVDMVTNFDRVYYLIIGDWLWVPEEYQNHFLGAYTSLVTKYGIFPLMVANDELGAKALSMVFRKSDSGLAVPTIRKLKLDPRLSTLCQIEGVSRKRALFLLDRFKSIERIMKASVKELMQVPTVGEWTAKNIVKTLHEPSKLRARCENHENCTVGKFMKNGFCKYWNGEECILKLKRRKYWDVTKRKTNQTKND